MVLTWLKTRSNLAEEGRDSKGTNADVPVGTEDCASSNSYLGEHPYKFFVKRKALLTRTELFCRKDQTLSQKYSRRTKFSQVFTSLPHSVYALLRLRAYGNY